MKKHQRPLAGILVISALGLGATAQAQEPAASTTSPTPAIQASGSTIVAQNDARSTYRSGSSDMRRDEQRHSMMPYTHNGYVGLNLGRSDYDVTCGTTGSCDRREPSGKIYTGGMINRYFGLEIGYLHMGEIERGGGDSRAHGVNVSVVGRLPIVDDSLALFAKAGATYGRTRVRGTSAAGIGTGSESGFGPSFGAGVSYDFARNWTLVAEWERHEFKFAHEGREDVDSATVGIKYRF